MRASVLCLVAVAACYDLPTPDCGFACGPQAACPTGYACDPGDARCHRLGTSVTCSPGVPEPVDAGDRTAPEVSSFRPAPDAQDVLLTARISVVFSERVVGASPVTILVEGAGQPVATTVTFDIVTHTATVAPVMALVPATIHTVTVTDDLIDLAGNPLAGPTTWQFTTSTPPRVSGRAPSIDATGVAVNAVVVASFNEQVFGFTSVSYTLTSTTGPVSGMLSFAGLNTQVTFTPVAQLAPNTLHTASLTPAIVDVIGNSLVGAPVSWSFTTGPDTIGPSLVLRAPEVDSTDVPVTTAVIARFDEAVTVDTTTFTLTAQNGTPVAATIVPLMGGRSASLRPTLELLPSTTYTARLAAAIMDATGNTLLGAPITWSFTTAP